MVESSVISANIIVALFRANVMNGKKAVVSRGFRKGNRKVNDYLICCPGCYTLDWVLKFRRRRKEKR
jgi:hypothetical protein